MHICCPLNTTITDTPKKSKDVKMGLKKKFPNGDKKYALM